MARSGRFIDEIGDNVKLRAEVAKAEMELEKLFKTVRREPEKTRRIAEPTARSSYRLIQRKWRRELPDGREGWTTAPKKKTKAMRQREG
jgi:hypothetical protein